MSMLRSNRWDVGYSLLLVGAGAALAGLAATSVALRFAGMPMAGFYLAASLAAALLGPGLWWWAIIKPGHLSVRRELASACSAPASPIPSPGISPWCWRGSRESGRSAASTSPTHWWIPSGSLYLAGFSLIYVGWITVLIGGIAGGVVALLQSVSGCAHRWRLVVSE